jgi:hypothetical protein
VIYQPGLFDDGCRIGEALELPIELLDDDPDHPHTEWSEGALTELAQDIVERGALQQIIVASADTHGRYRIRIGGQRWRAARLAGLTTVAVVLRPQACDGYDQVAENLKRCALSPLDLARFNSGTRGRRRVERMHRQAPGHRCDHPGASPDLAAVVARSRGRARLGPMHVAPHPARAAATAGRPAAGCRRTAGGRAAGCTA